jgi:hypothetical protein
MMCYLLRTVVTLHTTSKPRKWDRRLMWTGLPRSRNTQTHRTYSSSFDPKRSPPGYAVQSDSVFRDSVSLIRQPGRPLHTSTVSNSFLFVNITRVEIDTKVQAKTRQNIHCPKRNPTKPIPVTYHSNLCRFLSNLQAPHQHCPP